MSVLVMVDGGFLNVHTESVLGYQLKFVAFRDWCLGYFGLNRGQHFRTYFYDALPYVNDRLHTDDINRIEQENRLRKREAFHRAISRNKEDRIDIRTGTLKPRHCPIGETRCQVKEVQKGVDLLMGLDLAETIWKTPAVDTFIMVTGDADLVPAVEFAKRHGKTVYLLHGDRYHPESWEQDSKAGRIGIDQ